MKKYKIITLGCKVNTYESEFVSSLLQNHGYEMCDFNDICDIYIINTCTVTENSSKKSRQIINRIGRENPSSKIILVGCMAEEAKQAQNAVSTIQEASNQFKKESNSILYQAGKISMDYSTYFSTKLIDINEKIVSGKGTETEPYVIK